MEDVVTIQHRNVCKDGFTVVDEVDSGEPLDLMCSLWSCGFITEKQRAFFCQSF